MITAISLFLVAATVVSVLVAVCYLLKLVIVHPYQAGILWLLGCLFVPFFTVVFVITHFSQVKETLFRYLLSAAVGGVFLSMMFTLHGGLPALLAGVNDDVAPAVKETPPPRPLVTLDQSRAELDQLSQRVDALVAGAVDDPGVVEVAARRMTASELLPDAGPGPGARVPARPRASASRFADAFRAGQTFDAAWTWGNVGGKLVLTVVESRDGRFTAKLSSVRDPRQARGVEGTILGDGVRVKTIWRDGIPREGAGNPLTRDASHRWLYADSEFDIALTASDGSFVGTSGATRWRLEPAASRSRRS